MPDDKKSRDKQAHDVERRQRERAVLAELERGDETEPPVDSRDDTAVESELESLTFPATGTEVVAAVGDREIETVDGAFEIGELILDTDVETFDSPSAVRLRVSRPTVALAMKRIVAASETLPKTIRRGTPFEAYEKTLQELQSIEADDDDEGIQVISDWIVERITVDQQLPASRAVRRRAARFCRENGYQVHSDDWLGI